MFKKLLLTTSFAISSFMASADNLAVNVLLTDGTTVTCNFAEKPQMTFDGSDIVLSSEKGNVGKWEFSGVTSWSFIEVKDLDNVNDINNTPSIVINGDEIVVNNLQGSSVSVFDVSGKLVLMQNANENGIAAISINGLRNGVYVLRAGNNSIKFIVK